MSIRNRLGLLIMLGMIAAALWSVFPISAQSNANRWSTPHLLGPGWFPSLTVDQTDTVHIGWHGGDEDNPLLDLFWYSSRHPGEEFQTPIDVIFAAEGGYTIRSAMDVDANGILYAMYRSGNEHAISDAPAEQAQSAQAWHNLIDFENSAYYLDMTIDRDNVIHTVSSEQAINLDAIDMSNTSLQAVQERFPCAFCSDLIYRRSTDEGKTWTSPINISNTFEGSERPQIFQGGSGRLYITWSEGSDWYISKGDYEDVRFVYSDDSGVTWSDPIILAGDEGLLHPTQFTLTEMNSGALLGVWRYDNNIDRGIYFQISEDIGQTWTKPEAVPYIIADSMDVSTLDRYELLTDLVGVVHLFAVGYDAVTDQGPVLFHMEYRQGDWLQPNRIYYDPEVARPEWPKADVGPRNDLHLSWFVRVGDGKDAGEVGTVLIYYADRAATLPDRPVLAAFAPTLTPVPLPTRAPQFEPTATAVPTLAPMEPNASIGSNRDLYATQTILGAVLAVGVLCVVILFIFGFRPRS
jgi:hypothetical protein